MADGVVVCVTGGSGCIGSWVVRLLLDRGYTVHATVQDLKDESETKHLEALEGAEARLRLFQIDLLDYGSIVSAVNGCAGVFHLASPCIVGPVQDPEELLDPAIKGTINVLTAAKEAGVSRVVVTSSMMAMNQSLSWRDDLVGAEDCWTDIEYCKQQGSWYPISKTLAEKAAWDFAREKGLDVVVVNPGMVLGPVIPPRLNSSMSLFLLLLQGRLGIHVHGGFPSESPWVVKSTLVSEDLFLGYVHFKDVALAHILVYENKSATGRHLCVESVCHYGAFAEKVAEICPEYNVPTLPKGTRPGLSKATHRSKKLTDLGLQFIPVEQTIKEAAESLKSKGFIS